MESSVHKVEHISVRTTLMILWVFTVELSQNILVVGCTHEITTVGNGGFQVVINM